MAGEFKPMLASPAPQDIKFPVLGSPKLDGIRVVIDGGIAKGRSLKPIPNQYVQHHLGEDVLDGLDGEVTVGPPTATDVMQATTSGIMTRTGQPDFTFWVFDFWTHPDLPYIERHAALARYYEDGFFQHHPHIQILQHQLLNNAAELEEYEAAQLALGAEGVMLRSLNGPYKYGRSTTREGYLLKVKRFQDGEAVVTGAVELMHNANEATVNALGYTERSSHAEGKVPMGVLGALVVQDVETGITFSIGSGYTAVQRAQLWAAYLKGVITGQVVKYKHFTVTGVKDAPRFPTFQGFRDPIDMG